MDREVEEGRKSEYERREKTEDEERGGKGRKDMVVV
jgi:hypothetical protein